MSANPPSEPPPSYEAATGASASTSTTPNPPIRRVSTDGPGSRTARNGIPLAHRRSMEDEHRPLPEGWIRQFDAIEQHQFFVDTRATPPRSTWVHPYDDDTYLSTLTESERREHTRLRRTMTVDDVTAESSDEEGDASSKRAHHGATTTSSTASTIGNPSSSSSQSTHEPSPKGLHKLTRRMKDSLTSTTHAQREAQRAHRAEQERRAYAAHLQARRAMALALQTGQPQFLCKDQQGRDVYIEPPGGPRAGGLGYGRGAAGGGYGRGAYGYNPYAQGPYADPNARFVRPAGPYGRPLGYGYGGGIGAPVAAGFLGGALLGGLMF